LLTVLPLSKKLFPSQFPNIDDCQLLKISLFLTKFLCTKVDEFYLVLNWYYNNLAWITGSLPKFIRGSEVIPQKFFRFSIAQDRIFDIFWSELCKVRSAHTSCAGLHSNGRVPTIGMVFFQYFAPSELSWIESLVCIHLQA
jgi:hypothetical protein